MNMANGKDYGEFLFDLFAVDIVIKRNEGNLSLQKAADEIGIGKTTLYDVETKHKIPNVVTVSLIIKWLGNGADKYFLSTNPQEL